MNLKPVVTSLFLMGLACGSAMAEGHEGNGNGDLMHGSDLEVVDATINVTDVDITANVADVTGTVSPQVTISGRLNADYVQRDHRKNAAFPYVNSETGLLQDHEIGEDETSEGRLGGNAQLNLDADLGDNNAHVGLIYSIDGNNGSKICNGNTCTANTREGTQALGTLGVNEAYAKMKNLGGTPLTLKFGHGFTDFGKSGIDQGNFDRYPVVRTLTHMMTQTRANFIQLGMNDLGMKGVHLSGYMIDHKNANDIGDAFGTDDEGNNRDPKDRISTWGVNFGYNFFTNFLSQEQWGFNFGYVAMPGAVELVEHVTLNPAKNGAFSINGHVAVDAAELDVSFVKYGKIYDKEGAAGDRRTIGSDTVVKTAAAVTAAAEFGDTVTDEDAPSAWNLSASYSFLDTFGAGANTKVSLGYANSQDTVRLYLPQHQFIGSLSQGLGNGADLTLSYVHQTNFDKKDAEGNALQVNGVDMKGASSNVISARLSYVF